MQDIQLQFQEMEQLQLLNGHLQLIIQVQQLLNISFADTYHASTLVAGKIAPGTKGSFDISVSKCKVQKLE